MREWGQFPGPIATNPRARPRQPQGSGPPPFFKTSSRHLQQGIGWPTRALLHYLDVDFVDYRITMSEWKETIDPALFPMGKGLSPLKAAVPYNHVPLYADGDVVMQQQPAILRYLGRKHGMVPTDPKELIIFDQVRTSADPTSLPDTPFKKGHTLPPLTPPQGAHCGD